MDEEAFGGGIGEGLTKPGRESRCDSLESRLAAGVANQLLLSAAIAAA